MQITLSNFQVQAKDTGSEREGQKRRERERGNVVWSNDAMCALTRRRVVQSKKEEDEEAEEEEPEVDDDVRFVMVTRSNRVKYLITVHSPW
jgi:hypothetical protein